MKIKSNDKNGYKLTKYLTCIFAIVIVVLMIPSCSVSNSDNNSDLTNNDEIATTTPVSVDSQPTSTEKVLHESTTNETETEIEFDSLRSELEYNHGKMISYKELKYRNWSVYATEESPNNWTFFIDFTEDTSVEENIAIVEQDISTIETLENIKTVNIFWFDTNGDILGWRVSNLNRGAFDFTPNIMNWFNDDYKEAYSTLHPEEQSQTTSDEPITSKTETTEPPTTTEIQKPTVTIGQKNALDSAKSYLRFMAFSYEGIIKQLEYEGFSNSEAVYAADNCGMNSKDQVLESALLYLKTSAFSYSGLIEQLEYEGFSHEDAVSAADRCGADWNEQAAKSAKAYLQFMDFTKSELIDQLQYEGFTYEQAAYGAEVNGL